MLPGIMRIHVLRACAALSIPVVQQAPHWSSHATWREAFLTNRCGLMHWAGDVREWLLALTSSAIFDKIRPGA